VSWTNSLSLMLRKCLLWLLFDWIFKMLRSTSSVSFKSSVNLLDNIANTEHFSVEDDNSFDFNKYST
jgi:hypothetical protein